MNTSPFWTLSTIRRPSASPNIRVANESSPSTRSDASRATAVPLPIATATSAPWSAGASFTPSPVTATIRWSRPGRRARAAASASGVERATTWRSRQFGWRAGHRPRSRALRRSRRGRRRARPRARSSPPSGGDRRSRRRPGSRPLAPSAIALGDAGADRVREADQGTHLPRLRRRCVGRGRPAVRRPRPTPRSARPSARARSVRGARIDEGEHDLGGAERELLLVTVATRSVRVTGRSSDAGSASIRLGGVELRTGPRPPRRPPGAPG